MTDAAVDQAIAEKVEASPTSLRLAIIGDLHDFRMKIWPWELMGKPLVGQMNLWLNRSKRFDRSLIAATVQRAGALKSDLSLFTGDLTTTGRQREFASVAGTLQPLFATPAIMVPGNHDRYTFTAARSRHIERHFPRIVPETFPHVHPLIGRWRLVAVNAAVPRLFDSCGLIGERQRQHVQSILESTREGDGVIVLCHYPFGKPPQLPPMKRGHRLLDETSWRDTLRACQGRMIIVHGHVHMPWLWRPDDMPHALDINAGSPTHTDSGWPRGQGFWTIDLPADPAHEIVLTHHVLGTGQAPVGMLQIKHQTAADEQGWLARTMHMQL